MATFSSLLIQVNYFMGTENMTKFDMVRVLFDTGHGKDKTAIINSLNDYIHVDYMLVRETELVVADDMKKYMVQTIEEGWVVQELRFLFENEESLAFNVLWTEPQSEKNYVTTNLQLWKDGKCWREIISGKYTS